MNWFHRPKKRKRRKRKLLSGKESMTEPARHGTSQGWEELDRQEALSYWLGSHGVK